MRKPNLRKTLVLFSVYIILTLSMAQMVMADGYCRELDIGPGPSTGDALIEYCTYPVEFKTMGKWGYFVYGYIPEGKEIELEIEEGPQLELENMQDPAAASHTTGSDEIDVFESGAFLLFTTTSTEELELSTEDDDVYVSGTEECKILMQEKFITEQLIQLEAENEVGPTKMKLNIIADMLGLMGLYTLAIAGAPPGGGGTSCEGGETPSGGGGSTCEGGEAPPGGGGSACDAGTPPEISGGGTGCEGGGPIEPPDGTSSCSECSELETPEAVISCTTVEEEAPPPPPTPPIIGSAISIPTGPGGGDGISTSEGEGDVCTVGGTESEYPSFEIVEVMEKTETVTKWRIRIKEGALAGQEFIFESAKMTYSPTMASFDDTLYKTDGTKIANQLHHYGFNPGQGTTELFMLEDAVFEEFQGKGLAKIFNEHAFGKMLEAGMTSIETTPMMSTEKGANPFIAKTYKNMKFGPRLDMMGMLDVAESFEIVIKESEYFFDSESRPYQYAEMKVKGSGGTELGEFYLFLEDAAGRFLEGPEGEAVYNNIDTTLKSTEEVRTVLIDYETRGKTLWGAVGWEAKDIPYLQTEIVDKIVRVGGTCPIDVPGEGEPVDPACPKGIERDYPSFEIDEFLVEEELTPEVEGETKTRRSYRIKPKSGDLAGQEFIFESVKIIHEPGKASFQDTLYKLDGTKIAFQNYHYGFISGMGQINLLMLDYELFEEFQGKGLTKIFNEYSIARLLEAGMTSIETTNLMDPYVAGANPFVAKTYKNMKFGPGLDMVDILERTDGFAIFIRDSDFSDSQGRPYKYADISVSAGLGTPDDLYLFLEDADGKFLEGPEGEAIYRDNLIGKPTEEVRAFLIDQEVKGRTLWGNVPYKAKDMGYLKTSIWDMIDWICPEGCVRTLEPLTRDSYDVYLGGEKKGNLITETKRVMGQVHSYMKEQNIPGEIIIQYTGSSSYRYSLQEGKASIVFDKVNDLDYHLLFRDVPESNQGDLANDVFLRLTEMCESLFEGTDIKPQEIFTGSFDDLVGTPELVESDATKAKNYFLRHHKGVFVVGSESTSTWLETKITAIEEAAPSQGKIDAALKLKADADTAVGRGDYVSANSRFNEIFNLLNDQEAVNNIVSEYTSSQSEAQTVYEKYLPEIESKISAIGACPGGGCARFPDTFPENRESFHLRDPDTLEPIIDPETGKPKNLIDTIEQKTLPEIRSRMAAEGIPGDVVIDLIGSNTYFYTLEDGTPVFRYEYVGDVDYSLILTDDVPDSKYSDVANIVKEELGPDMNEFFGRDVGTNVWFTEKLGRLKSLYSSYMPTIMDQAYYGIYIGEGEMLGEINSILAEIKGEATPEVLKLMLMNLYDEAHGLAADGNYEKAVKRQIMMRHLMGDKHGTSDLVNLYIMDHPDLEDAFKIYEPKIKAAIDAIGVDMCYRLGKFIKDKTAYDMKNSAGETRNFLDIMSEFIRRAKAEQGIDAMIYIAGSSNYLFLTTEGKPSYIRVSDIDMFILPKEADTPVDFLEKADAARNELIPKILQENGFDVGGSPEVPEFTLYEEGTPKTLKITSIVWDSYNPEDFITVTHLRNFYYPDYNTVIGNTEIIDGINTAFENYPDTAEIREAVRNDLLIKASDLLPLNPTKAAKRIALAARVVDTTESHAIADEIIIKFDEGTIIDVAYLESKIAEVGGLTSLKGCYRLSKSLNTKDAFKIKNPEGVEYNLLNIMDEAFKKTGESGLVGIKGSTNYIYDSPDKLGLRLMSDVDLVTIDFDYGDFYNNLVEAVTQKGFNPTVSGQFEGNDLYSIEILEEGQPKTLELNIRGHTQNFDYMFTAEQSFIDYLYAEGMTFVGDEEYIQRLDSRIEEFMDVSQLKEKIHYWLVYDSEFWVNDGDYEKACKRLMEAAYTADAYEVRDSMHAEFKAQYEGAADFKSVYDKYLPIVTVLKVGSMCIKLGKSFTTKDAYIIENTAGQKHNLLDIMSEALKKTGEHGSVGIWGSAQYLYKSPSEIDWAYPGDVDMAVVDVEHTEFYAKLLETLAERGFTLVEGGTDGTYQHGMEIKVGETTRIINLDYEGVGLEYLFDPGLNYYHEGMTFIGPEEQINTISDIIGLTETEDRVRIYDVLVRDSRDIWAESGDYERAFKRITEAAWVMDRYDVRGEMYAEFKAEFDGAKDFQPLYEKWFPTVEGLKFGRMCVRLSKSFTTRDAYTIENVAGEKHNLLDILYKGLKESEDGVAVGIRGSTQYLYESPDRINWKYPYDVDMVAIDSADPGANNFYTKVIEEFTARGFNAIPGGSDGEFDFGVEVKVGEETIILNLDHKGRAKDYLFDPSRIQTSYPEDMTFVGDEGEISDIVSRIEDLKSAARVETRHGYLVEFAEDFAFSEDFEKASKRLIEAAYTVDAFELRDQMYAEFKTEFDGAKDFRPFYEKYIPIVEALKPQSRVKIFESARRYLDYAESIETYRVELSTAVKELDEAKAIDAETRINALEAEIRADAVMIPDDLAGLEEDIQGLKETATKVKEVLALARELVDLEDDAVRMKMHEVMEALMEGRSDMTEDATLLYEKVGQELITAKAEFDALPEEKKATWAEKIAEKKSSLKSRLEAFIDFTGNVRTKWHQSKYYKRVYEVMEWPHEKLGKLGKDRLATLGKATGVAMVGIGIVQILAEDIGGHWQIMGDNMNNPFYVMVGRRLETFATWIGVGFIAMIAVHILIALVKGGLLAALISLAVWLVLFVVLAVILTTGLKYFWCDYMNKSLAGDPICMILYGPNPIVMTASIQGTSGTCTMAGTWDGQSEMNCN